MPPKKGKKGKGKKGKGKKGKGGASAAGEKGAPPRSEHAVANEREIYLQKQYDALNSELVGLKKNVEDLRHENEFLQEEAQQTRLESHEYMSYMSKKTHKRQSMIVSLSDQNQKELDKINLQKEKMLKQFEDKRNELKSTLLEKENLLAKAKREYQDLSEYRDLRDEQVKKIKQLEREVLQMRGKHSDTIQQLKAKFLLEKAEFHDESENKIQVLAFEANKKAVLCLNEHTNNIKVENRELRAELMDLIKRSQILNQHKQELEEQKKQLLREKQYSEDIRRLRGVRQQKAHKKLEILNQAAEDRTDAN